MNNTLKLMGLAAMLGLGAVALPATASADALTVVYSTGYPIAQNHIRHVPATYDRPVVVKRITYVEPRHHRRGWKHGWHRKDGPSKKHHGHEQRGGRRGHH